MLRSLSRAQCAIASSLLAWIHAQPPAKWSATAERRQTQRRAAHQAERHGVTHSTDRRPRRR